MLDRRVMAWGTCVQRLWLPSRWVDEIETRKWRILDFVLYVLSCSKHESCWVMNHFIQCHTFKRMFFSVSSSFWFPCCLLLCWVPGSSQTSDLPSGLAAIVWAFLGLPSVCLAEDHNYGTWICIYAFFFKAFLLYIFWCHELFLRVLNQEWLIWLIARKDPDNGIRIWENMCESCIHFFPYTSFHICTLYILYILHHMIHACFFPC